MNQLFGALMIVTTAAALPLISLAGMVSEKVTPEPAIERAVDAVEVVALATTRQD